MSDSRLIYVNLPFELLSYPRLKCRRPNECIYLTCVELLNEVRKYIETSEQGAEENGIDYLNDTDRRDVLHLWKVNELWQYDTA